MAKPKNPKYSLPDRRGVFSDEEGGDYPWYVVLIQIPGRTGLVDLDELRERLTERGLIGASRRDIGPALHAGKIPTPAGEWGLLVALPGQAWAYLLPSSQSFELPGEIAKKAGVRVIGAGYQDTAGATSFDCYEGAETLVRFESCGMGGAVVENYSVDPEAATDETQFSGTWLAKEWIKPFKNPWEVQNALAKEFDAFIPCMGATTSAGAVKIFGFDVNDLKARDYLRIDEVGFGDARLEPSPADHQLLEAILAGDIESVRNAVAAGAELHRLPDHNISALHLALSLTRQGHSRRDLVAALLELGAVVDEPGAEPAVHVVLDALGADQDEMIVELFEMLQAHGANIHAQGCGMMSKRVSPLHLAARRGSLKLAKYLVSKGADIRAINLLGWSPRQEAESAARSLKEFKSAETDARYAAVIDFLANAEA